MAHASIIINDKLVNLLLKLFFKFQLVMLNLMVLMVVLRVMIVINIVV